MANLEPNHVTDAELDAFPTFYSLAAFDPDYDCIRNDELDPVGDNDDLTVDFETPGSVVADKDELRPARCDPADTGGGGVVEGAPVHDVSTGHEIPLARAAPYVNETEENLIELTRSGVVHLYQGGVWSSVELDAYVRWKEGRGICQVN